MSWAEAKKTQLDAVEKLAHTPDGMRAFSALPNNATSINLTFLEPEHIWLNNGTVLWTETDGVMIRYSDTDYPETPTDGTLAVDNKELGKYQTTPYAVNGLTEGTTYYFSAFPYSTEGVYGPVSHATAIPFEGERVQVTVTLPEGMESATVKCVDETDTTTESKEVTQSQNIATFFVDTGHSYHVEYGDVYGYVTPPDTESKIASGGGTEMYNAEYVTFSATINVTYTEGATCTCTLGDKVLTAPDTTGFYAFTVGAAGTWTVKIEKEGEDEPKTTTVEITENGQTESVEITFIPIVPWSTGSDEDIAAMLQAHYEGKINIWDYWEIGQERVVHLNAISGGGIVGENQPEQTVTWVLMHKGGYQFADGSGTCTAVVGMKDCLKEKGVVDRRYNSYYNGMVEEDVSTWHAWADSSLLLALPEVIRALFKGFKYSQAHVDNSRPTSGTGNSSTDEGSGYLAMLSQTEVTGSAGYSEGSYTMLLDYYQEQSHRIKYIDGTPENYALRTTGGNYKRMGSGGDVANLYQTSCNYIATNGAAGWVLNSSNTPRALSFIGVI